jgi:hypothetical protein
VGIAAVGLAAGFALYLKGEREPNTVIITQGPAAPAATLPERTPGPTGAAEGAPAPTSPGHASLAEEGPKGVSLDALESEVVAKRSAPAAGRTAGAAAAPTATPSPASPGGGAVHAERVVLEEDQAGQPGPEPSKTAATAASARLMPAELTRETGALDRPSTGAAQAAVGAVLGAARSCIAGHPHPSSATLIFGSSGEVKSVSVGGPVSGTAAADCVEAALKKARVQPFAAPTFSLAVTVRPP